MIIVLKRIFIGVIGLCCILLCFAVVVRLEKRLGFDGTLRKFESGGASAIGGIFRKLLVWTVEGWIAFFLGMCVFLAGLKVFSLFL